MEENQNNDTNTNNFCSEPKVEGNIHDNEFLPLEEKIVSVLRTVYDPEIPVNIYDLGMIYRIDVDKDTVNLQMTLTAPNCPAADFIVEDVRQKIEGIDGVNNAVIDLVFEPMWDQNMMTDEAKLELGLM